VPCDVNLPPFSPPLDSIIGSAHLMQNKLDGLARGVGPVQTVPPGHRAADDGLTAGYAPAGTQLPSSVTREEGSFFLWRA